MIYLDYINIKIFLGIIAGIVSSIAYIIYFISIFKGESKPSIITWWIWTFMGGVLALSYYYSGARSTMWAPIVEFVGPFITAILSIKYGEKGKMNRIDFICLIGALISIFVWILTDNPVTALVLNILIDQLALIPTIRKSYINPKRESVCAWSGTLLGDLINLLAVDRLIFSIIIYPIFMVLDDLVIVLLLKRRKI